MRRAALEKANEEVLEQMSSAPQPPEDHCYSLPKDRGEHLKVNDLAGVIVASERLVSDASGSIFRFNGRYLEKITDTELRRMAMVHDVHEFTSQRRRHEVLAYLRDSCYKSEIPWRQLAASEVPCFNGVVDVHTCEVRPHRFSDYLETVIPFPYDHTAKCPIWLAALDVWFGGPECEEKTLALQEFMGYCLLPHARYKRALFLYGESDTGKSQVPLVLKELVGPSNHCTISTEEMADPRKREDIVGKMVNLLTELPAEAMIADSGFKQLVSTGDPIAIDPKFQHRFNYVPFCKHVIACNNLPSISDQSKATFNRLLILKFNNVIPKDQQDKHLMDKLVAELPGILAWAVEGAARLIDANGEFTYIEESARAVGEYRESENPMVDFIRERTDEDEDGYIPMSELREKFCVWSGTRHGPKRISQLLKSAGVAIGIQRCNGRPVRCALGRRLPSLI
jgi:P4 family phage/plasmid primase-like protien